MSATKRALLALKQSQEKLNAWERTKYEPIAIIGIGCRFPGGIENAKEFGQLLADGKDAIGPVPADRWDVDAYYHPEPGTPGKMYSREGGFLGALDRFDPRFFNISPVEAKSMDPQQRLLLEVAWEAFEHGGQAPQRLFGSQTGVFVGMSNFDFATQMNKQIATADIGSYFGTGSALSVAAGRLSYVFGLTGPSMVVDTACSSSLVSTDLACKSLRSGDCNLAIAAGVNLIFSPETSVNFSKTGMLSVDSRCKTFSATANGYVRSEGCGVLLLKRLSDAIADGDRILAQVVGTAVNQDGPSGGLTVPNGVSQEQVIRKALANARVEPGTIDYIETHGTGTSLGDPIEIEALGRIFAGDRPANQPLVIGSVKTNIGHGEGAAGIAGIIKVVQAMANESFPKHLHLEKPNPHIPWDQLPLRIPLEETPWPRSERPRLAGVSSFGFSGTNAHVIIQEGPRAEKHESPWQRPLHLLALSARNQAALKAVAERYHDHLETLEPQDLGDLCFTANVGRSHFRHRLCTFGQTPQQLRDALKTWLADEPSDVVFSGELKRQERVPKPVFLFTGQGSQYVGMGRDLFESEPTFRKTLQQCADILDPLLDRPLLEVLFSETDSETINQTAYAQPALFALEYALAQMFMAWGLRPGALLGHSVGELTAACIAGVFSLEEGLKLIAKRGQLLQSLPKTGAMQVVFAPEAEVQALLEPFADRVAIAAVNGPKNVVLSGESQALETLVANLAEKGFEARALPVSHAFHSPLVDPIMDAFAQCFEGIKLKKPSIPLIANLHGDFAGEEVTKPEYWVQHLRQPVQFAKGMQALQQKEHTLFVELGPKPVLRSMGQRVLADDRLVWLDSCRAKGDSWNQLMKTMATLYNLGVVTDWQGFESEYGRQFVDAPTYPFQRKSYWPEKAKAPTRHQTDADETGKATTATTPVIKQAQATEIPAPAAPVTLAAAETPADAMPDAFPALLQNIHHGIARLLQMDPTHIDVDAPFLELGADSLILIDAVRLLEKTYRVPITIRQLFEELPTIKAVAVHISQHMAGDVALETSTQTLEKSLIPVTPQQLAEIQTLIGGLMQIPPEEVDVHTPFLELGADSLIMLDVIRKIEATYGVVIQIQQLFEDLPTIQELTNFIFQHSQAVDTPASSEAQAPSQVENPSPSVLTATGQEQRNQIQHRLAKMVAKMLQMTPEELDPHTPFLELGADSLVLIDAIRAIEKEFGIKLSIQQLFEDLPDIVSLADFLAKSGIHAEPVETAGMPAVAEEPALMEKPQPAQVINQAIAAPKKVQPDTTVQAATPMQQMTTVAPVAVTASPHLQLEATPSGNGSFAGLMSRQLEVMSKLMSDQLATMSGSTIQPMAPVQSVVQTQPEALATPPVVANEPVAVVKASTKPTATRSPFSSNEAKNTRKLSPTQQAHIDTLMARYIKRTKGSKAVAEKTHGVWADMRASFLFREESKDMAYPIIGAQSQGPYFWDVDGNQYVDIAMGFGVNFFGHNPDFIREALADQLAQGIQIGPESNLAGDVARLIHELTGVDRVTFCNSGTEAVMTAIRIARAATGKSKIVIFSGSYHGHSDPTLVVGKKVGQHYQSLPMTLGVPESTAQEALVLPYDQPRSLEIIREHLPELAAVIVEPIQSRQPHIQPKAFLQELREITQQAGVSLVFDEVLLGFRIHPGGAQHWCGVQADVVTYGKVVGGGLPLGVVSGKARWMDLVDGGAWGFGDQPEPRPARTFVAGTFSKHPLAMTAAKAVLERMKQMGPSLQASLNAKTKRLAETVNAFAESHGFPLRVAHFGSLFRMTLTGNPSYLFQPLEIDLFFYHLIDRGVYTWEGRTCYLSTTHTDADISHIIWAIQDALMSLREGGFWPAKKGMAVAAAQPVNPQAFPARKLPTLDAQAFEPTPLLSRHQTERALSRQTAGDFKPDTYLSKPPMVLAQKDLAKYAKQPKSAQFSLFFFGNYASEFMADKYNLLFDATEYADRQGFTAVWFPERHFHEFGGYSPNPSLIAASLAKSTRHIQLRAGSVVLPIHHPVRVVEEWSVVDNISQGRVGVSVASGWHPNDFIFAPENYESKREKMFESIEEVRQTWRGNPVTCLNGVGQEAELNIFPMPMQAELPIWLTIVHNPEMYIKAGEMGAGILTNLMGQSVENLRKNIALYRESLAKNGFDPATGHVTVLLHTFITEDAAQAREIAREPFCNYLRSSLGLFKGMLKAQKNDVDLDRVSPEDLEYIIQAAYDRYVKTTALIGSVETCAPIMAELIDAGMDEAACFLDFGVDPKVVMEHLEQVDVLRRRFHQTAPPHDPNPGNSKKTQVVPSAAAPAVPVMAAAPERAALNAAQRQLILLAEMDDHGSVAHNESMLLEMKGDMNRDAMERAFQAMVSRHETLRTSIDIDTEEMIIHPTAPAEMDYVNLSHLSSEALEPELQRHLNDITAKPFDFEKPPLVRMTLFELGGDEWRLLLTFHNLVLEGWSVGILFTEMNKIYRSILTGKPHGLEPATPFRQLLHAQKEYGESEARARDEAFWLDMFQGEIPMLQLPTDRPRPARAVHRGARLSRCLSADAKTALTQLGRSHRTTLFMTLQACFMALLHRISGQNRLVTAYSFSGRAFQGCEQALGHGTHYVPIISEFTEDMSFSDFLTKTRRNLLTTYEHQRYPFAWLVDALKKPGQTGALPLAQVLFNLERTGLSPEFGDLDNQLGAPPIHYVHFDLFLNFTLVADRVFLDLDYSKDLFNESTVEGWIQQYECFINHAFENPKQSLTEIPILNQTMVQQLLDMGRGQALPQPFVDFATSFAKQANIAPESTAIDAADGTLTYAELDQQSHALANELKAAGVGQEQVVPVFAPRETGLPVALLGILKRGAAFVVLDPQWPNSRLLEILKQIETTQVVVASAFQDRWQEIIGELPSASSLGVLELKSLEQRRLACREHASTHELVGAHPDQLAYLIFTSGSTGVPKGVMLNQRGFMNHLLLMIDALAMTDKDHLAQTAEPSFDIFVWQLLTPLLIGGRVCMIDKETVQEPDQLMAALQTKAITIFQTVPTLLDALLTYRIAQTQPEPLNDLKLVLPTGEALPPALANRWLEQFPEIPLVNAYGPAECSDDVTLHRLEQPLPADAKTAPIGRAVAGLNTWVLDGQLGLQPPGFRGELFVSGAGLGRGYLADPAKTAAAFLPAPFSATPGQRMYRTGDMVWMDADGLLHYDGRRDHQIKLRGMRIELGEIIRALETHDQVAKALVTAGSFHGEPALIGYVVPKHWEDFDHDAVRHHARQRLPEFMVPATILPLKTFPTSPNGKIDRKALPDPSHVTVTREKTKDAPTNQTEQQMLEIWCEVLNRQDIGIHDHFFDIGGHSLLASKIMSRVRKVFKANLSLRVLFTAPTVAALCAKLPQASQARPAVQEETLQAPQKTESKPLVPQEEKRFPVIEAQRQLILQAALAGDRAASYVEALSLELKGHLDLAALNEAVNTIVQRHETTRSAFDVDRFEMRVFSPTAHPVSVIDLRDQGPQAKDAWMKEKMAQPMDLTAPPLCRFYLLQWVDNTHIFVAIYHLAVFDGWSMSLLIKELQALYPAALQGQTISLAENRQFNDFRQGMDSYLASSEAAEDRRFWLDLFDGSLPELDLPRDRPYPAMMPHKGGRLSHYMSSDTWRAFGQFARKNKLTPFMAGLGLYGAFLHRLTGQEDLVVGTMTAGRGFEDNDSIMGYCSHFLPIRMNFAGDPTLSEGFATIRKTLLQVFQHQKYPFANLIRDLGLGGSVDRFPLFMASFNIEPAPESLEVGQLQGRILANAFEYANYAIHVNLTPQADGVSLDLDYSADLFDAATAERWLAILVHLFETCAEATDTPLSQMPLQAETDAHQFITEAYQTSVPFTDDVCFPRLFEQVCQKHGSAIAAIEGERQITYAELNQEADRIAASLVEVGVTPETVVPILADRGIDFLLMILGILKAGGAWLPLDPTHPSPRLIRIMNRAKCDMVLTSQRYADKWTSGFSQKVHLMEPLLKKSQKREQPVLPVCADVDPSQLAYVIFTSGSTGEPKGAMLNHRGMINHITGKVIDLNMTPADVVGQTASQCFDISVWQFLAPLAIGATVEILPDPGARDAQVLADLVMAGRITIFETVPLLLRSLSEVLAARSTPPLSLRWMMATGEALPPEYCRAWLKLYPDIPIMNAYGPTECSDDITHHVIDANAPLSGHAIPIGKPLCNTQLFVRDRHGNLLPDQVPGELFAGGAGVGRGYLGNPRQTALSFVPNPFGTEPGDRLYKTGDRVRRLKGGVLDFMSRLDTQVKVRGYRIELGEIESVLLQTPAIVKAAALVQDHPTRGKSIAAFCVHEKGIPTDATAAEAELRTYLTGQMPAYMVPDRIAFLAELPANDAGKLDRRALPFLEPHRESFVAASNEQQQILAEIWSEALEMETPSITQSFFALGGNSLIAMRVLSRIQDRLGVRLSLTSIFENPTIQALAQLLDPKADAANSETTSDALQDVRLQRKPLCLSGHPAFVSAGQIHFDGILDHEQLKQAITSVARRQPALQLVANQDGWLEAGTAPVPTMETLDLSKNSIARRKKALEKAAVSQAKRPFKPGEAMLHLLLVKLGKKNHRLLFHFHTGIGDGWSAHVFVQEVAGELGAAIGGAPQTDSSLTTSFTAHVPILEREVTVAARTRDYWHKQLQKLPQQWPLPAQLKQEPRMEHSFLEPKVSETLREAVLTLAAKQDCTPNAVYLAALFTSLATVSDQTDLVVNTAFSGRHSEATHELIAPFARHLPLQVDLANHADLPALLKAVTRNIIEVHDHQDMDLDLLKDTLAGASVSPRLGEVLFIMHRDPVPAYNTAGLAIHDLDLHTQVLQERLVLHVTDQGVDNAPLILWEFGPEDLAGEWVEALSQAYLSALESFVQAPDMALSFAQASSQKPKTIPPLIARNIDGPSVVSHAQERLWLLAQFTERSADFNIPMAIHLQGDIQADALAKALTQVVARHEVLRTVFVDIDGEPRQQVLAHMPITLEQRVLSSSSSASLEEALEQVRILARQDYDMEQGPLLRAELLTLDPDNHLLSVHAHHLICDGWSISILAREWAAFYSAIVRGETPEVKPLTLQYRDFAAWERDYNQAILTSDLESWWDQQLADLPQAPALAYDHTPSTPRDYVAGACQFSLPPELGRELDAFCQERHFSPFMVLLAAFKWLLARESETKDIVVGTAVAQRPQASLEPLIGYFVNNLVLRSRLADITHGEQLLQLIRRNCLEAFDRSAMPFEKLVARHAQRQDDANPLFQVMFLVQNAIDQAADFHGALARPLDIPVEASGMDLTIEFMQRDGSYCAVMEYQTALYNQETIQTLARELPPMIQHLLSGPTLPLPTKSKETARFEPLRQAPLAPAQERLWSVQMLQPELTAYHIAEGIAIEGALDVDLLARSLDTLVYRHESLRTGFALEQGEPVQRIYPAAPVTLPLTDLRAMTQGVRENALRSSFDHMREQPFDLEEPPLFRFALFQVDEDKHILMGVMHHIIADEMAFEVLVGDLTSIYQSLRQGQVSNLPPLTLQNADVALALKDWETTPDYQDAQNYWARQLEDLKPVGLPYDFPKAATASDEAGLASVRLSDGLTQAIRQTARLAKTSPFVPLLAGLKALLRQFGGREDIAIGTSTANRPDADHEALIAFMANTLVLRTDLSGNLNFEGLIERVRDTVLGAFSHEQFPFQDMVKLTDQGGEQDLFRIMFTFQRGSRDGITFDGLQLAPLDWEHNRAKFDIFFLVVDHGDAYEVRLAYRKDRFAASAMKKVCDAYKQMLTRMTDDLSRPIDSKLDTFQRSGNQVSKALASLWNMCLPEVLKNEPPRHFIQQGGDMAIASELSGRIHSLLGMQIPASFWIQMPLFEDQLAWFQALLNQGWEPLPDPAPLGPPPTNTAERLARREWSALWKAGLGDPHWQPHAWMLKGLQDSQQLVQALEGWFLRHPLASQPSSPTENTWPIIQFDFPEAELMQTDEWLQELIEKIPSPAQPLHLFWATNQSSDHLLVAIRDGKCLDDRSVNLLLEEMASTWDEDPNATLHSEYFEWSDFLAWQSALPEMVAPEEPDFWARYLRGAQPISLSSSQAQTKGSAAVLRHALPQDLLQNLKHRYDVTPLVALQAALAAMFARPDSDQAILFGRLLDQSNHPEFEAMVGNLKTTLPVVTRFKPHTRLADLPQMANQTLAATAAQRLHYTGAALPAEPTIVLDQRISPRLAGGSLAFEEKMVPRLPVSGELEIQWSNTAGEDVLHFFYHSGHLATATVQRYSQQLVSSLEALVKATDMTCAEWGETLREQDRESDQHALANLRRKSRSFFTKGRKAGIAPSAD